MHVVTVYHVREEVVESIGRFTYVRPGTFADVPYYVARCACGWSGPHRRPLVGPAGDDQTRRRTRLDATEHVDADRFAV